MSMIATALRDASKRLFSPAAILTGGASLGITSAKAVMNGNKSQAVQAPATPAAPPQAAKAPQRGAGGMGQAGGTTFLTGAGGVDASSLNLGRNTLLGQ